MKEKEAEQIRMDCEVKGYDAAVQQYGKEKLGEALAKDPCFKQPKELIDLDEIGRQAAQEFYEEYGVYPTWWKDPYQMIEF